jgi:hypothetical protein
MPSSFEVEIARLERRGLTFQAFRSATRGLPPAMQLDEFLRLPKPLQDEAWQVLCDGVDAEREAA